MQHIHRLTLRRFQLNKCHHYNYRGKCLEINACIHMELTNLYPDRKAETKTETYKEAMPQESPKKNTVDKRKLKRMMTALAACAAIVVLIPVGLMMMPMGKAAPAADGADCAAPEMAMDDAADTEFFVEDALSLQDALLM